MSIHPDFTAQTFTAAPSAVQPAPDETSPSSEDHATPTSPAVKGCAGVPPAGALRIVPPQPTDIAMAMAEAYKLGHLAGAFEQRGELLPRVEMAEFQAGLMREQQTAIQKAHSEQVADLYGHIGRLKRQVAEAEQRLESVCVPVDHRTVTLQQILEDPLAFGCWPLCSVCLKPECTDQGMCK